MNAWYEPFAAAIRAGGFFTNGLMHEKGWDRTIVCSSCSYGIYSGNSFWVTNLVDGWYLGTWGAQYYRLPDESRIAELCINWCTRFPEGTFSDFDDQLKQEFGLIHISEEEFDQAISRQLKE